LTIYTAPDDGRKYEHQGELFVPRARIWNHQILYIVVAFGIYLRGNPCYPRTGVIFSKKRFGDFDVIFRMHQTIEKNVVFEGIMKESSSPR